MGRQAQGQRDKQSQTGNEKRGTHMDSNRPGEKVKKTKAKLIGGTDNHSQKNKGRKYEAGQGNG